MNQLNQNYLIILAFLEHFFRNGGRVAIYKSRLIPHSEAWNRKKTVNYF